MTNDEVWELVLKNERLLKREVGRYVSKEDRDEAYSDVVLGRVHRIMELYDGQSASPITHLCANVRWYAYKWARRKTSKKTEVLQTNLGQSDEAQEKVDLLDDFLSCVSFLTEMEQTLLRFMFVEGYTHAELTEWLGKDSRPVINEILDKCRRAL